MNRIYFNIWSMLLKKTNTLAPYKRKVDGLYLKVRDKMPFLGRLNQSIENDKL